jgi:hypothetical protein
LKIAPHKLYQQGPAFDQIAKKMFSRNAGHDTNYPTGSRGCCSKRREC